MFAFDHFDAIDCLIKTQCDPEVKVVLYGQLLAENKQEVDTPHPDNWDEE